MGYRTVVCPFCVRPVQTIVRRSDGTERLSVHTRMDGTGQQCPGVGLRIEEARS